MHILSNYIKILNKAQATACATNFSSRKYTSKYTVYAVNYK